jgi:hypothetical protein
MANDVKVKLTNDGAILSCPCGRKHEITLITENEGTEQESIKIEVETTYSGERKEDEKPINKSEERPAAEDKTGVESKPKSKPKRRGFIANYKGK